MGFFWNRAPRLPPQPPFGPLDPGPAASYFGDHLSAHSHLFPSESAVAWEAVRGWDLNEQPPHLGAPGMVTQAVLTDRLLHFCDTRRGSLSCAFDFLLHMIAAIEWSDAVQVEGAAPGTGLLAIYTPSGRTLMCCSGAFASRLGWQLEQAKQWAASQGMDVA